MNDLFSQKLEWFKANEKPEVVLLIADDPQKIRLLVAWTNTTVNRAEPKAELIGEQENAVWGWLWDNVTFDMEELRTKSAIPNFGFDKQLQFLIGNRLIFPDGTMNSFVQRYLRERVLKLFEAKAPKAAKKAKAGG